MNPQTRTDQTQQAGKRSSKQITEKPFPLKLNHLFITAMSVNSLQKSMLQ